MTQTIETLTKAQRRLLDETQAAPVISDEMKSALPMPAVRPGELPADHPRVVELRAKGHTGPMYDVNVPAPPSQRHKFRTKGDPFSRIRIIRVQPGAKGQPARVTYRHLTRKFTRTVTLTPQNVRFFIPQGTPFNRVSELLGGF